MGGVSERLFDVIFQGGGSTVDKKGSEPLL